MMWRLPPFLELKISLTSTNGLRKRVLSTLKILESDSSLRAISLFSLPELSRKVQLSLPFLFLLSKETFWTALLTTISCPKLRKL